MAAALALATSEPEETGIDHAVREWLHFCRGHVAPKTRKEYATSVRPFLIWTRGAGLAEPEEITDDQVLEYGIWLAETYRKPGGDPLSKGSRISYLNQFNIFLRWAKEKRGLPAGTAKLPSADADEDVIQPVELDEYRRMRAVCDCDRDRALLDWLWMGGVRAAEAASPGPEDFKKEGNGPQAKYYVRVKGKTGRRWVPVSKGLYSALQGQLAANKKRSAKRVFVAKRRKRGEDFYPALGASGVLQLIRSLAEKAGIERRISPQMFRQAAINRCIDGGVSESDCAEIMGNSVSVIAKHHKRRRAAAAYEKFLNALEDID